MSQTLEAIKPLSVLDYDDDEELGEMDPIEAEVDAIRQQIYQEIKNMNPDEQTAYFLRRSAPLMKQYNFRISTLKSVEPRKRQRDVWDDD